MSEPDHDLLPDYAELSATLQRCGFAQGAAEVHGFAVGLSVASVDDPGAAWRRELYSEFDPADVLAGECRAGLDRVFASVFGESPDAPLALTLLLPTDIEVNVARLAALRDWSQGFLFGVGLGGAAVRRRLSEQAQELLHDIAEFTRLDTDDADNSEENQAALIAVEEYLREAVMLIRDEAGKRKVDDEHE